MSEILKPCPFCPDGGDLQLTTFTGGADDVVHCHTCGTILKHKIWQIRPIEDELQKRIAELERDFDMLFRAVIAASKQSRKNTLSQTFVYGKEREE